MTAARVERPLAGRRVAVTRAAGQASDLIERLRSRGADALACPAIAIAPPLTYEPLDAALRVVETYDWIVFTSANAVHAVADRLGALGLAVPTTVRLATVGAATARHLEARLTAPDFVSPGSTANALASELPDVAGQRILLPRGDLAGEALPRGLHERGGIPHEVVAYRTIAGEGARELADLVRGGEVDAILFMSGSSVRYVVDALGHDARHALREVGIVCVRGSAARAAREARLEVGAVAADLGADGMVDAAERWFNRHDAEHRNGHL